MDFFTFEYIYWPLGTIFLISLFYSLKAICKVFSRRRTASYATLNTRNSALARNNNGAIFDKISSVLKKLVTRTRASLSSDEYSLPTTNTYVVVGSGSGTGFVNDYLAGLSSDTFNLSINLADGDLRNGLSNSDEIKIIMKRERVSFDTARLIRQQQVFSLNNIDPSTGLPLDPKAVVFS